MCLYACGGIQPVEEYYPLIAWQRPENTVAQKDQSTFLATSAKTWGSRLPRWTLLCGAAPLIEAAVRAARVGTLLHVWQLPCAACPHWPQAGRAAKSCHTQNFRHLSC